MVWAHRGARSLAPENTLAAARKALEVGADGWEVDVRLTKDGHCVLFHDFGLLRTTDFRRRFGWPSKAIPVISRFTLQELSELDAGSWFFTRDPFGLAGEGCVRENDLMSYRGEKIPTLAQALDFTRENNWRINIEIKDMRDVLGSFIVYQVAHEVKQRNMTDQVLISSFRKAYLVKMRRLLPEVKTAWLTRRLTEDVKKQMGKLQIDAIHPRYDTIEERELIRLQHAGFLVNVYTVNDPKVMENLIAIGVDGIITDFPHKLRELLLSRES